MSVIVRVFIISFVFFQLLTGCRDGSPRNSPGERSDILSLKESEECYAKRAPVIAGIRENGYFQWYSKERVCIYNPPGFPPTASQIK